MTDKEKIRNIIELFIAWNGETDVIDVANIDSAVEFIADSLQEKPVSEDLEEAAKKYAMEEYPWQHGYESWDSPIKDFKAGAKWKEEQMTSKSK